MNRSVVSPSPSVNDVGSNLSYLPSGDVQKALEGQNVSGAASQNGCPNECSNHGLFINLKEDADIFYGKFLSVLGVHYEHSMGYQVLVMLIVI
jgi:hypothetical protein